MVSRLRHRFGQRFCSGLRAGRSERIHLLQQPLDARPHRFPLFLQPPHAVFKRPGSPRLLFEIATQAGILPRQLLFLRPGRFEQMNGLVDFFFQAQQFFQPFGCHSRFAHILGPSLADRVKVSRAKAPKKYPNPKSQTNSKSQVPNPRKLTIPKFPLARCPVWNLESWSLGLVGIWNSEFGVSFPSHMRIRAPSFSFKHSMTRALHTASSVSVSVVWWLCNVSRNSRL